MLEARWINRELKNVYAPCVHTRAHTNTQEGPANKVAAFARGSAQYDVSDSPRRDDGGA